MRITAGGSSGGAYQEGNSAEMDAEMNSAPPNPFEENASNGDLVIIWKEKFKITIRKDTAS